MKSILGKLKTLRKDSEGQALVLVAVSLAMLLGFGALTTDLGFLFTQRRSAQNIADAAALSASWKIHKGETAVNEEAKNYGEKHNMEKEHVTGTIVNENTVKVVVEKEHDLFLGKVIGLDKSKAGATAYATRTLIWYPGYKDVLPLGITRFPELFYKVDKEKLKNKHNAYYDLFNKESHDLYSQFHDRPGILKDSIKDYLLGLEGATSINIREIGNDFALPTEGNPGIPYPSKELENKLLNNILVYKGAWEVILQEPGTKDIKFGGGESDSGNFGLIQLDGIQGGGTPDIVDWIKNGLTDPLDKIIGENGNKVPSIDALNSYFVRRGREAFILGILPSTINPNGGHIVANKNQYVILHVRDLEIIGNNPGQAKLIGKIVEVFYNIDDIEPGKTNSEHLPQSWLVKEP